MANSYKHSSSESNFNSIISNTAPVNTINEKTTGSFPTQLVQRQWMAEYVIEIENLGMLLDMFNSQINH